MASAKADRSLNAAGTVVLRPHRGNGEQEVLLIHRPRYDDWSLPKGKIDTDEYLAGCAVRETVEETSVRVRLGVQVERRLEYRVSSRDKQVTYWRAQVRSEKPHVPNREVDQIRWLPVSEAIALVSYVDEMDIIQRAVDLPETVPVVLLRHGKAMARAHWTGRDQARPLDARGRRQAELLVPLLDAFGVQQVISSSSTRCAQTVKPYGKARRLEVETWSTLSEEQAAQKPKAVTTLMKRLLSETLDQGRPAVVCGHRPVLPLMFAALGVEPRPLKPGAAVVAHVTCEGQVVGVEEHRPRV